MSQRDRDLNRMNTEQEGRPSRDPVLVGYLSEWDSYIEEDMDEVSPGDDDGSYV